MTAQEKLMQLIVFKVTGERRETPEEVRERYAELQHEEGQYDALSEVESELRSGTHGTSLPCDYSRHYESKSVAAQMLDGSWVGWTYWYGGGKHGEPRSIPWIEDAYDVTFTEETVVVKKFRKVDPTPTQPAP